MACNEDQSVEVEAMRSIYCQDGEMVEDATDPNRLTLTFAFNFSNLQNVSNSTSHAAYNCNISFSLPPEYPQSSPSSIVINVPALSPSTVDSVKECLETKARDLQGEMVLHDLVCLAKELLENEISMLCDNLVCGSKRTESDNVQPNANAERSEFLTDQITNKSSPWQNESGIEFSNSSSITEDPAVQTCILRLDHMRSRASYTKLIKSWANELNLVGRLIFHNKLILIILQGSERDIRQYIVRNRTINVDVDSRGKNCKERMLSVICQTSTDEDQRWNEFSVVEVSSSEELASMFKNVAMETIYHDHVEPLTLPQRSEAVTHKHRR